MRTLNKNKQKLYYALFEKESPVYETSVYGIYPGYITPGENEIPLDDAQENIVYVEVDGVKVPVETGETEISYATPVLFKGNISLSGGEADFESLGIDRSNYDAILIMNKNEIPITESSIIWHESAIVYKDSDKKIADATTADYRVKKRAPSLNQVIYLLERIVK